MICKIRKWDLADAADLAAALSNRKVQDNLRDGLPYPYTEQDGVDFISTMLSADENETFAFAITADGRVVGSIGVFRQGNIHRQTAELGYYIAEEYWGKGIMTEAVKQVCEYVFDNSDMIRIYAEPFAYNMASCRVLEKAGFQYEGTLRNNAVKNGKVVDMKMYSLLKEDGKDKDFIKNLKKELETKVGTADGIYLNDIEIDPLAIKAIMINEVVPSDPSQDFYGNPDADYLKTTIPLLQGAGAEVHSIQDILQMGIYITNAVKTPKTEYAIDKSSIENSLPYLEAELSLFPNVKVIMLMGDVAKKAFNMITKKATKKNAVPAVSTYKLRSSEIYYKGIRVMPSYIMTGGNILIEKSKVTMATEDIAVMLEIIK